MLALFLRAAKQAIQRLGEPASYTHTATATVVPVTLIDRPNVRVAPSGFDAYQPEKRHEMTVLLEELNADPVVGDTIDFNGGTYRVDDITDNNGAVAQLVVVKVGP